MTHTSTDNASPGGEDSPSAIVAFWRDAGPDRWFAKDVAFDGLCRSRFLALHMQAAARQHDDWMADAEGALALILLLDQIPRNVFRGTAHMYATDPLARHFAQQAVASDYVEKVEPELRVFFCLPFSHSENLDDQDLAVRLNTPLGESLLSHAIGHRDIIHRFGRFPHRNPLLARETTAEEAAFLAAGGFAG